MGKVVKLSVPASAHDVAFCPVSAEIPISYTECAALSLVDAETGKTVPSQIADSGKGVTLTWLIDRLAAGKAREYVLQSAAASKKASTVAVDDDSKAGRVDVRIAGELFTAYHYKDKWARPFLYPVIGPFGTQVTRNWPVVGTVKGEHRDHVHHKSIWVAYGECDKVDNWSEEKGHGWQRHRKFLNLVSGNVFGQITAKIDWCANDETKQFEETRDMRFYALPGGDRLFDICVAFRMTQGKVVFHDTKEGGLVSVRVASSMDVRNGGKIENGYGGVNESETWGKKAPWCDYSGTVDGKHVGIAVFDHEKNPRYPTEWHVRDYGLMTANSFAWSHYRPEDEAKGDMAFNKGASPVWRYRLYIHRGDAAKGNVRNRFLDFVAPPKVAVE